MAEKRSISISDKLYREIKEYCEVNNLKLNIFVEGLVRDAFNIERYGATPFANLPQEVKTEDPPKTPPPTLPHDEYAALLFKEKIEDGMKGADKQMEEIVENSPNIEEVREAVDELVFENKSEDKPKKPRKITRLN